MQSKPILFLFEISVWAIYISAGIISFFLDGQSQYTVDVFFSIFVMGTVFFGLRFLARKILDKADKV